MNVLLNLRTLKDNCIMVIFFRRLLFRLVLFDFLNHKGNHLFERFCLLLVDIDHTNICKFQWDEILKYFAFVCHFKKFIEVRIIVFISYP